MKDYHREGIAATPPTSADPLNRRIDAARPESETGRRFSEMVDAYLADRSKAENESQIKAWLNQWRDQRTTLEGEAMQSSLLKEIVPISQNLSSLATAGLTALAYMDKGEHAPEAWEAEQLNLVEQASKPQAQLLLMVAPPIQRLIEGAAGPSTSK